MIENKYESQIFELFDNFKWIDPQKTILAGHMPAEIFDEVKEFTKVCNDIKHHKLSFLKNHVNIGKNKFQVSVPIGHFEDSFTFAYLINLGKFYTHLSTSKSFSELGRNVTVRRNFNHFDHYNFWINFIEPGDINNWHTHAGTLSGVIYVDNEMNIPTNFAGGYSYNGIPGDIVIFPSTLSHMVEVNNSQKTRITYAFNLDVIFHNSGVV